MSVIRFFLRVIAAVARRALRLALLALRLALRVLVIVVPVVWRAPGVLLLGLPDALRRVRHALGAPGRLLAATRAGARCVRCGEDVDLYARWRCPICKATETTHAWAPCSTCGTDVPAGYVSCSACGEAVAHPRLRGLR